MYSNCKENIIVKSYMILCLPPFHAHMNNRHYTDTWVLILVGEVVLLESFQDA